MQVFLNGFRNSFRSLATGTRVGLFILFTLCLGVMAAGAQTSLPIVVTGPSNQIGDFHLNGAGGGWFSGQAPLGGTFVVGANGHVIVGAGYGKGVFEITPTGTQTVLANFDNSNAAGMDKDGNVYVARDYGPSIIKLPYNAASGTYTGFTTLPTANCLGGTQDTAACVFAPGTQATISAGAGTANPGFTSLFFDDQGNFFFVTDSGPKTNPNTIYECSAQCQAETDGAGTYPPVAVYADSKAIGPVAIDPWGNLFFSDGASNGPNTGVVSNLNELPLQSGHYASSPTVIESYTTTASYNALGGLFVAGNGTVYFAVANDGTFALPNTQSGPNAAGIYKVSSQGGKGIALDAQGNLYSIGYNSNDVMKLILVNKLSFPASVLGTATSAIAVSITDNAAASSPTLSIAASEFGLQTSEFGVTPDSSCSTAVGTSNGTFSPALSVTGSVCTASITFTPAKAGQRSAALTIADTANSAAGFATLTGVGQGSLANVDPGVNTPYATGFTTPVSVVADAAGNVFVADQGAGKVFEIAAGTTTPTSIGTGFTTPSALAFDANGNLFVADSGIPAVFEILNAGTTGAFAAGAQSTVVSGTALFGGVTLGNPAGLAVGPDGLLYIADLTNKRVVTYNSSSGALGATNATGTNGLKSPVGVALDASANLYVADDSLNQVFVFAANGPISTVTPSGLTQVTGIAVDPSGSLIVADKASGSIVRIPALSGSLDTSKAIVIEKNPQSAASVSLNAAGDIFTADSAAKSVFAIQRTAAAIDIGSVQDGVTNSGTVYVMNAGNAPITLATPAVAQPTNTMFTLTAAAQNGCTDGSQGPAGAACQFTATFSPPVATPDGPQTGTASVQFSPAGSALVTMTGIASISSIEAQAITGFTPPTPILAGQHIALSATGGGSGNPVVFSIDPSSPCLTCATVAGNTLTATAPGTIIVNANQAAGSSQGVQYAAAPQVKATIVINAVTPTGVPALIMNQLTWLNPTGSFNDGQNPQGGSFAVTQNGQIVIGTTYSDKVYFVNAQTGSTITTVKVTGPGGITVDSHNNLYISHLYNSVIYKIPFVNGAYVAWSDSPTPAPPACTGTDTAQCTFVSYPSTPARPNSGGLKAIAFDPSGNFYMVSEPDNAIGLTGQSYIYECDTTCQPAGTGTVLYSDPNGVSQIAFDPWGNLFFTDANYNVNGVNGVNNSGASSTNLNELVYTSGTGFASTPTVLQTYTNDGGGGNYDDMLASVAVDPATGTIYYGVLYDGVFAIPNTRSGGPQVTNTFAVSSQGAKALAAGTNGSLYLVANTSGADTVGLLAINNLSAGTGPVLGTPVTASAIVVDNAYGCGTAATLAFTSTNTQFSATAGTTCSSIGIGGGTLLHAVPGISSYPMTISFGPTSGGPQSATLGVSDTTNGGTGTAALSGSGQEIPQTITITAPTTTTYTYAPGLTVNLAASGGASNHPVTFTVDLPTSTGAGTIANNILTVTKAGTIVINANQAGGLVNNVYYQDATQVQVTLTINQATQSVTFAAQGAPVTFAPGLTITMTATGGPSTSPVVFSIDTSSTGAGTIAGNILTVTQAGNIVVNANQAADANYMAAPQVQQTFVVNKAGQTIAFVALNQPLHYIMGGLQVQISATGGATNQPIVFTVDAASPVQGTFSTSTVSGSTSTATLTIMDQAGLAAFPANVVIDANQPGDTNYTDATQASETIALLKPLPTQIITFTNPGTQVAGTPLPLTGTASSGFPITYTATPASACTVTASDSGAWSASFTNTNTTASTCTITAYQPGDNLYFAAAPSVAQVFAVNPSGMVPAMTMNLSLSSLTLQAGTVGLTQITVNSLNNFSGPVTFTCSGEPSGYSCSFNPSTVSTFTADTKTGLPLGTTASSQLSINGHATAANHPQNSRPVLPAATLAVALCLLGFRKRRGLQLMLLAMVAIVGLGLFSGCGGSTSQKTKPTASQITVTATSGKATQTATLNIILE